MLRPLMGTLLFAAGLVPVAITIYWPSNSAEPFSVGELSCAVDDVDTVALELVLSYPYLVFDHALDAENEVRHGDVLSGGMVGTIEILGIKAGQVQDGFAHGLARDCASMDADATDGAVLFDHRNALSGLCSLDGGTLAPRAGANASFEESWVGNGPSCLVRQSRWDDWTRAIPICFELAQRRV